MKTHILIPPENKLRHWGEGSWVDEPDRMDFEAYGLPCLLLRQLTSGHWCGYVAVHPGHPLHGVHYDDVPEHCSAHGGLTFSDSCEQEKDNNAFSSYLRQSEKTWGYTIGDPKKASICHDVASGEPDNVWWFGFDAAHFMDVRPGINMVLRPYGGAWSDVPETYKDISYMRRECENLAKSLARCAVRDIAK